MTELTERQRQVLEFIDAEVRRRGFPPSVREIGEAVMRPPDPDAIKASFLVPADVERLTFADLQERRKLILDRMGAKAPGRNRRR